MSKPPSQPIDGITETHAAEIVEVFRMDGLDHKNLRAALSYRSDLIGEQIDTIPFSSPIGPSAKMELHAWMIENRAGIRHLLDF